MRGEVKLTKKNESIDKWQWAYNLYQSLITWKEKQFDQKVEKAMKMHLIKLKMQSSMIIKMK